jgi:hypothetical protein
MGYARIIRGDILSVKQRDLSWPRKFAVSKMGEFSSCYPSERHLPTLVLASLGIGDVVLSFAALSFGNRN